MTTITYNETGVVTVTQGETEIKFRLCDLRYNDRIDIMRAVADISPAQEAGPVGFLKTQPVEVRQEALEEALGTSFPMYGDPYGDGDDFIGAQGEDYDHVCDEFGQVVDRRD